LVLNKRITRKKNKRQSSLILTISTTGLLLIGGILSYLLFTQGSPLTRDLPVGANVIPQDALLAVSLTTDRSQWQNLQAFGTPETQQDLTKKLVYFRDHLLNNSGYDWQHDIQPWVGNAVTVAVLPPPVTGSMLKSTEPTQIDPLNSAQSLVMVLPVKDREIARNSLINVKTQQLNKWVYRVYQGITIKQTETRTKENLAIALLDSHFLAIANSATTIEKAIDAYKNGVSLATLAGFSENMPKIASFQPFAQFYVNVPLAVRIALTDPNHRLPAQVLSQLQNNQGLAGTITLESTGIKTKGVSWLNPQSQHTLLMENKAGTMQNRLPSETTMILSGSNLLNWWHDYASTSEGNPLAPMVPDELRRGIKSLLHLDLEKDLLNWMQGEFAVSLIPYHPQTVSADNFRAGLVLMVHVSDRTAAENSWKQIDTLMQNQYHFSIQLEKVGDQQIVNWITAFGTLTATHGWLDGDVAFLTLGAPVSHKIIPPPENALANYSPFQQTVSGELNPPSAEFFLDVEQMEQNFNINALFPQQQALLDSSKFIGVTTAVNDSHSSRYDVCITLKKSGK